MICSAPSFAWRSYYHIPVLPGENQFHYNSFFTIIIAVLPGENQVRRGTNRRLVSKVCQVQIKIDRKLLTFKNFSDSDISIFNAFVYFHKYYVRVSFLRSLKDYIENFLLTFATKVHKKRQTQIQAF